jgi:predicted nucleic acid-binding Zn ribbon protein
MQKFSDTPLTQCPACGADTYAKQITAPNFALKGSGWYVTDFRNNGGTDKSSKPAADAKSSDAGSAAKPADAAPSAAPAAAPAASPAPAATSSPVTPAAAS